MCNYPRRPRVRSWRYQVSSPSLNEPLFLLEMKPLESHPLFNPAIKMTEAPRAEKKPSPAVAPNDELNFNLFEKADQTPAEKRECNPSTSIRCIYIHISMWNRWPLCLDFSRKGEEGAEGRPWFRLHGTQLDGKVAQTVPDRLVQEEPA